MIGSRDRQLSQQVGINAMLRMLLAGVRAFVDGLESHQTHQPAHTVATGMETISRQVGRYLAAAEERILREHAVDLVRNRSIGTACLILAFCSKRRV